VGRKCVKGRFRRGAGPARSRTRGREAELGRARQYPDNRITEKTSGAIAGKTFRMVVEMRDPLELEPTEEE